MTDPARILIVEDDEILADNLGAAIEDRECSVVGPVATVDAALEKLSVEPIDGAILDANLLDRDVTPVAMELIERAIPFVIHTGVGLPAELATVFPHVSVIMKPTDPDEVIVQLLSQIQALRGPLATGSAINAGEVMGRDRAHQVEKVAAALFGQFGPKAIVLARRQATGATGDTLVTWLDIIDSIGKRALVRS